MTLHQFLQILRARWRRSVLLLVLTVGAAIAASLLLPKKYTATAQVLVDFKSPDPVMGVLLPVQMLPGYMATQVDIVVSQRVALMVVDALRIADNPQAIEQWREETDGVGSIRHFYAELLLKYLDVKPSRESSVLGIAYTGADPQFAALVANAFAQAYVDLSVALKVEPARQTRGFFDAQTQALRDKLEVAQARLTAYQRDKGIVSADERLDVENARLAELSSQLVALQALTVESAKKQAQARSALGRGTSADLPEVLSNPLVQNLKAEAARVDARLEQQAAVYGASHPEILKLRQERDSIRTKIDREMAAITGGLARAHEVQAQRQTELESALAQQREKVLRIKAVRDELTVLQREVESAQRAYEAAAQRLSQTSLESQVNQANVVMLTPAAEPLKPSSPKLVLNTALGVFLGTLLGVAGALAAELRDRRVRGPQDLELASGVAPMGTLRHAFRRRIRRGRRGRTTERHARSPSVPGAAALAGPETAMFAPTVFGALPADEERVAAGAGAVAFAGAGAGEVASQGRTGDRGARTRPGAAGPVRGDVPSSRLPIGEILVRAGVIRAPEVDRILEWARLEGSRFGEAAIAQNLATPEQVERALAYQFEYPVLERGHSAVTEEVVAAYDARNPLVADLRRLRTRIRSAQVGAPPDAPLKAVAVISSGSGDGKSFVAANLAVTFSQMGQRTLLVDADLRRGRIHRMFGLSNAGGLSAMLNHRIGRGSLQRVPGLDNLTVLTCGPSAPNPSELLSRETFGQLIDAFARTYDLVILDTPGVAEEPDATLVAQRAGAALVLARKDRSAFDAVVELVSSGGTTRVAVLGSVLNTA